MDKEKAKRILKIYQWARVIGLALLLMFIYVAAANAQSLEDRLSALEQKLQKEQTDSKYMPQVHGILRGKFEYQPEI